MKVIAKRLDMKTRDLLRLNPDVGRRPKPNTVIVIPNKDFTEETTTDEDKVVIEEIDSTDIAKKQIDIDELKKTFVVHQVKKGDTFYSLTRFYNVSEDELRALNPELQELSLDMILIIKPIEDEDEILIYQDTIQESTSIRLAMMLPFRAIEYDTIEAKDIFKTNTLANITTDLYLGASVAIDSLRGQGLNVELSLFDTGRKDTKLDSILAATDFSDVDAIIGPLYSDEVPKVANRAGVPVIFPVYSKKQKEFRSSKVIKTYADREIHQKELMDHILNEYAKENILIIGDSTPTSIRNSSLIQSALLKHDSIQETKIIHPSNGYIAKHFIINALKAEVGNWVILATDDNVIASDVINSLISLPVEEEEEEDDDKNKKKKEDDKPEMQILPEDTVIKVFGFDKANTYDRIDNNKLAKFGFTYTSDVFIDENSPAVQIFNKQYLEKNNAYPSYYATKGFDIVYDTAMRLASGNTLKETFKKGTSYRMESKFEYSRRLFSTSSNNGIYIIQYNPDLTLTRLK
ncbi:MAG: LysM peptidoglycan-binding domain-containing protein [Flavobacteriaceae bacterium]